MVKTAAAATCGTIANLMSSDFKLLGRTAMTAGAAFGCGYLGGQLGAYLDDRDQEQVAETAQAALESGKPQSWESADSGTSGTAKVVTWDAPVAGVAAGAECRTVRNTVTLADGSEKQDDVTAFKGADGEWEVQES